MHSSLFQSPFYVAVKSKLQHPPPPPSIPWVFDTFAIPARREFDYQSLPGDGKFDLHALGVGNLNCTLDFMWNLWCANHGGRGVRGFSWKRLCLCGQLFTRKGLKQALCRIWRYLNSKIFNIGFRLWIYECIELCLQWNTIPIPAIQCNNKKLNRGQLLSPAACMLIIMVFTSKIQLVVYYQCCILIGWATTRLLCYSLLVAKRADLLAAKKD